MLLTKSDIGDSNICHIFYYSYCVTFFASFFVCLTNWKEKQFQCVHIFKTISRQETKTSNTYAHFEKDSKKEKKNDCKSILLQSICRILLQIFYQNQEIKCIIKKLHLQPKNQINLKLRY